MNSSYERRIQLVNATVWLQGAGIGTGDAVTIVLPNLPQNHFALWGAEAAAIANPVNPMLDGEHMAAIMRRAGTRVLVTLAPQAEPELWRKVEAIAAELPSLRHVLCVDPARFEPGNAGDVPLPAQVGSAVVADFDAAIVGQPGDCLLSRRVFHSSDVAAYFHTGGTTGTLATQSSCVRVVPWHFVGLFVTAAEAHAKREEMGAPYIVRHGVHRLATDAFVWFREEDHD